MIIFLFAMLICLCCSAFLYHKADITKNYKGRNIYLTLAIIDVFLFWALFAVWATRGV